MYTLFIEDLDSNSGNIMPSGKLIQEDPNPVYHLYDNYIINEEEVTGEKTNRALRQDPNQTTILTSCENKNCKLTDRIEWNFPYEIQIFSQYNEETEQYSIEFRGIISDSISGFENSNRGIKLFGTRLYVNILRFDNSVHINPQSNFNIGKYHKEQIKSGRYSFNTNCTTTFLRIGYSESEFKKLDKNNPISVH